MITGTAPEQTTGGDNWGKVGEGVFQVHVGISSMPLLPLSLSLPESFGYASEVSFKGPSLDH